jgi:hypothetical protein
MGGRAANPTRQPMPLSERAKIFSPFDPLKGYRAMLAERERQQEDGTAHGPRPWPHPAPRTLHRGPGHNELNG